MREPPFKRPASEHRPFADCVRIQEWVQRNGINATLRTVRDAAHMVAQENPVDDAALALAWPR